MLLLLYVVMFLWCRFPCNCVVIMSHVLGTRIKVSKTNTDLVNYQSKRGEERTWM